MKLLQPSNRAEWLALRKGYISSTESAALFGYSPYATAFEVGVAKREADKATDDALIGNVRAKWGTRLQDAIARGVADDYGVKIHSLDLTYAVREDVRMGSSFDYQIVGVHDIDGDLDSMQLVDYFNRLGPGLLEIKNVDSLEYKNKWIDNEAPDHIEVQLQHQLETLGLAWGAIAALVGGNRVGLIVRERDEAFGALIVKKVAKFWTDFDNGILPDPKMPEDAGALIALHQYADPGKVLTVEDEDYLITAFECYESHRRQEASHKEAKDTVKANIFQRIGTAEKVISKRFNLSAGMIAPTHIEAYEKKGYRNFRLTAKKEKT